MSGRKLALTVHVPDEGGDHHVFRAGTVPPAWAQEVITNPHAWETAEHDDGDSGGAEVKDTDPGGAGDPGASGGGGAVQQPPRVGKGSGRDEWAAYAEFRDLAVTEQMSRDDIVAAVDDLDA
jgi:hypothetical protein